MWDVWDGLGLVPPHWWMCLHVIHVLEHCGVPTRLLAVWGVLPPHWRMCLHVIHVIEHGGVVIAPGVGRGAVPILLGCSSVIEALALP